MGGAVQWRRDTAALVLLAAMAALFVAGYISSHRVVRQVDVYVPDLSASFDGLRIAQLPDLRAGPQSSRSFLDRATRTTRELTPDVIAVTRDLIDDRAEDVAVNARVFAARHSPGRGRRSRR